VRSARLIAALFGGLLLIACSPAAESPPASSQPLAISGESDAMFGGSPAAVLDVALSRTHRDEVSIDATLTNSTPATFTTSANELLSVSADGRALLDVGEQEFGGDPVAPHQTRSWHLELTAPSNGVIAITATNWFVPRPERGEGAMDWGSVEVTASLGDLPVVP